jgi:hypothetical protein
VFYSDEARRAGDSELHAPGSAQRAIQPARYCLDIGHAQIDDAGMNASSPLAGKKVVDDRGSGNVFTFDVVLVVTRRSARLNVLQQWFALLRVSQLPVRTPYLSAPFTSPMPV